MNIMLNEFIQSVVDIVQNHKFFSFVLEHINEEMVNISLQTDQESLYYCEILIETAQTLEP